MEVVYPLPKTQVKSIIFKTIFIKKPILPISSILESLESLEPFCKEALSHSFDQYFEFKYF